MKKIIYLITLVTFLAPAIADDKANTGNKEAIEKFKYLGCMSCHSVKSAGIGIDASSKEESGSITPPDLSTVGKTRNSEWISNFLKKKEQIEGRSHPKIFKGDKAEREMISNWLASLKG
ncbi:MAG: c-type cytochrome [Oligoflexia bacterium]|nr:c-type cytochrome [Oligoflexia bacterium]